MEIKQVLVSKVSLFLAVLFLVCVYAIYIDDFSPLGALTSHLSAVAILVLFLGILFVFANDPYRADKAKIHHPRTHATIALLVLASLSICLITITVRAEADTTPYFIWMAFFIGTLGAALGALQRLDIKNTEANILFENLGSIEKAQQDAQDKKIEGVSEFHEIEIGSRLHQNHNGNLGDNKFYINRLQSVKLHARIIQQLYISIAIGGILGVFGLIVVTAFSALPDWIIPTFSTANGGANSATLLGWLQQRPVSTTDYAQAMFICILFGYSQSLTGSILNRAEDIAEDYISTYKPD